MKKHIYIIVWIICSLSISGQNIEKKIIGTWIFKTYDSVNNFSTYVQARKLNNKIRGYCFKDSGIVIVRMNSSGCSLIDKKGKSYSSLTNVNGTWEVKNDNCIHIKYESFMGFHEEIITLDGNNLKAVTTK